MNIFTVLTFIICALRVNQVFVVVLLSPFKSFSVLSRTEIGQLSANLLKTKELLLKSR